LFVPAVAMALYWVARTWSIEPFNNRPYAPALAVQANATVIILGPYVAVASAWEMVTLRSVWTRIPVRRSRVGVVLGRLGLVLGSGVTAFVVCYVVIGRRPLLADFPGWQLPAVSIASVLAWSAFGAALSLLFRPWLSVPAALVVPFLVLSLPQGWEPLWLRHVNGYLSDCCGTSDVLDPRAVHASLSFLGAVTLLSSCVIAIRLARGPSQVRRTLVGAGGAVVLAALVAAIGIAPVRHMGPIPTLVRSADALRCADSVCLWPEDEAARPANERAWAQVKQAWASLGLPPITARIAPITLPGTLDLATTGTVSAQAAASMAVLLPRAASGCEQNAPPGAAGQRTATVIGQRDVSLAAVSYLLLKKIGYPTPTDLLPLPLSKTPAASDAPRLWRSVGRC
jgi:hypothetical protein